MFRFEKLDAWQLAIELSDDVYRITRTFPDDERFGLTNQTRRAAVSIAANVAEGCGRATERDFSRFIEIAYGSLMEVVSHLTIALRQKMLNAENHQMLYEKSDRLARVLSGLRKSRGE
ncbi:MAG: four helix bundle protein [Schlesneria sp.]|nr:four helix bundle protein [Schlesneria sp.]